MSYHPSLPTLPRKALAVLAVLVSLCLAAPLPAATANEAEPSLSPEQVASAEDISGFLAQPAWTATLTSRNAVDPATVAVQQTLRNGTLTVELEWTRGVLPEGGTTVTLYPSEWSYFRGVYDTGTETSSIDRANVDEFLVDRWNRTLCGYRDMVATGEVSFPDGTTQVVTLGLTWQWQAEEMTLEEIAAAENTSCPLDPDSEKCQDHAACVVTVNCGIVSFDVDGRCLPQFPFGWPCLCDPLHNVVCDEPHEPVAQEN